MRRETQGALLLVIGGTLLGLVASNSFLPYVRAGLRIPLLAAALFLGVVGAASLLTAGDVEDADPHDHPAARVGLLVLVPVLVLQAIAPAPLGAFAASRNVQNQLSPADAPPDTTLPAATDGAVDMWLSEFVYYATHRPGRVRGETVRLIGFAANESVIADAFRLTRFSITCCAADARPLQVVVTGVSDLPDTGEWLVVKGSWNGEAHTTSHGAVLPVLDLVDARSIPAPQQPYEY